MAPTINNRSRFLVWGVGAAGVALLATGLLGCGDSQSVENAIQARTGVQAQVVVSQDTDVTQMAFEVTRVACDDEVVEPLSVVGLKPLEDMFLPGGIPAFEDDPLDAASQHRFADHFFVLPAGCYDVTVQPMTETGDGSQDCQSASREGVVVSDGVTTEIVLLLQCTGPAVGGLDVVGALNHPPVMVDLTYDPSKFIDTCLTATICLTAKDPDNDPLEFVWETLGNGQVIDPSQITETVNNDGSVTQCLLVEPTAAGTTHFQVTVFDLVWDDGVLVRVEDWLAANGNPAESRDSLKFPLYVMPNDDCEPTIVCPPVELVVMIDTSQSMDDEGEALCSTIGGVITQLAGQGITVLSTQLLSIAPSSVCGTYSCLTSSVEQVYGTTVPGNPPPGLETMGDCAGTLQGRCEDWGPATAIVAQGKAWTPGAFRLIVPISDEGPRCGTPFDQADIDAANHAISVAAANSVVVSPITGDGSSQSVIDVAAAMAAGTGGVSFNSENATTDIAEALLGIIAQTCVSGIPAPQ